MPKKGKKKGKPPKSAAKKKLTKSEKDKLKQEEDEKKLQEEEEEKQRQLQEAKEKAEKEKLEAVERKQLEAEESKKRKAQLDELRELIEKSLSIIRNNDDARRKNAKWERYMRCDGSADPTIAGEINTYINLEREDNQSDDIESVLPKCRHTRDLIEELEFIIDDTPSGELSESTIERYQQTIRELQLLINEKLDLASHDVTLKATKLMNSETLNLQSVFRDDNVRLYIWGNLSKNPRIKSFEFPESEVSFDIPKILTLSDIAYRCLITKFDHFSHLSKSYLPRKKVPEETLAEQEEPAAEQNEEKKDEENGEAGGDGSRGGSGKDGAEEEPEADRENTEPVAEDSDISHIEGRMDDLMALLNKPEEEDGEDKEEKAVEEPPEIIEDDLIQTPELEDFEDFDGDEDMIDLRTYRPLGGIIHFSLLHLPPQPKTVNSWTITQHAQPAHLNFYDYIADDVNPQVQALKAQAQVNDDPATKKEERPLISVQFKIPEDSFFFEDPTIARWDDQKLVWRQDGFQDTTFVEETRRLSFKTCYFGTFALLQDVHINMPFQSWEIRPKGLNHCLFTLIAAIVELEIEVKDTECCLVAPLDRPEVAHLRGKWMSLRKFQAALRETGINIFPNDDSHKYVTIQDKNSIAETRLYQQMGLTASAMAYSWSKWNGEKESDKLIIQAAPHIKDEPLIEDDWSLFMITRKRSMKLRMSEFDENFSEDFAEGSEFHADMYHMAQQLSSEEGQKRLTESSTFFTHTVAELLRSTRFLIYS